MLPSQPRGRPASLLLLLLLLCLALSLPFSHSHSLADVSYPFQNASLPLPVRLSNLLSLLTLDEKLSLLYQSSPPIPRLSIPRFDAGQECLHGLINRRSDLTQDGASTAFPQSIGLAASWNRSVFTEMGRIIGDEARGKRNLRLRTNDTSSAVAPTYLMCWTPVVNILKDPRWGRSAETYGEAPLLTYALTSRLVQALHGDDERYIKIAPTLKHFTAYDGPEEGRHSFNAVVSARDLHDTFTFVYRRLIEEEPNHVRGLMASYSAVNGVPVACDFDLLTRTTRYDWGWRDGHVVSDCDAVTGVYADHHYTPDLPSAAALSLIAGMDVDCGSGFNNLTQALQQGLIQPADVDVAVSHLATVQLRLGFYDQFGLSPYDAIEPSVVDSPEHRQAALDITHQSMVLLKNEGGFLPLQAARLKRVAVIGPSANDTDEWQQCFYAGGGSCLLHHIYHAYSSFLIQPLQGIQAYLSSHSPSIDVVYARGCARYANDSSGFDNALRLANSSDVTIFIGGLDYGQEEEDTDRSTLELPDIQRRLLAALAALPTPVVSVMIHGGAVSDQVLEDSSRAILLAFYPGEWAGTAIADVLFGAVNPSGRLPYTVYSNVSQLPDIGDDRMAEGVGRTYAFLTTPPRYYFGDGLSYTSWAYSHLNVTVLDGALQVNVSVSNEGNMAGDETVQIYAAYDSAFSGLPASTAPPSLSIPRRFLLDFTKVHVPARTTVPVQLLIPFTQLTAFGRWTLPQVESSRSDLAATRGSSRVYANVSRLSVEEVKEEIERMREMRRRLESGEVRRRGGVGLGSVTLPVWISVGGRQPTVERVEGGLVLVQKVTITAPVDDVDERGEARGADGVRQHRQDQDERGVHSE